MRHGNSDGKGRTGLLEDLAAASPLEDLPIDDPLRLIYGTMIVLSAEIKFLPIKGKEYYLYERGRLYMAMIPPEENRIMGDYIGACIQRPDSLWEVELARLPSPHLQVNNGILHGKGYDERFGYYNRIMSFHVAKRVLLLPSGVRKALITGQRSITGNTHVPPTDTVDP